jgi:hypothetical protein
MRESAEQRTKRLEQVAHLTEKLRSLEDLLRHETDENLRVRYESEMAAVMQVLREIPHQ